MNVMTDILSPQASRVDQQASWIACDQIHYKPGADFEMTIPQLALQAGRITAVIGGNGSGKTTLLKMVLGTLVPQHGAAAINGKTYQAFAGADRVNLGVQLQNAGFNPSYKVGALWKITQLANPDCDDSVYDRFGLAEIARRRAGALSSGQMQRLQLALALAARPKAAIFDEPTSNLDASYEDAVIDYLGERKGDGFSAFVITHAPRVLDICDDVLILSDGKIDAFGAKEALIARMFGTHAVRFEGTNTALDRAATTLHQFAERRAPRRTANAITVYGDAGLVQAALQIADETHFTGFSYWRTGAADILEALKDER